MGRVELWEETWKMAFHSLLLLVFHLVAGCSGRQIPCEEKDCTAASDPATGILILGGGHTSKYQSVEFWSAENTMENSCVLDDFPKEIQHGPTADLVSGRLVVCNEDRCDIFHEGSWEFLVNTTERRGLHSSATMGDAVLLIGGYHSESTEWIPIDGSSSQPGPFTVRHGRSHCTMQTSDDTVVVTGGRGPVGSNNFTNNFVTQYNLIDGTETDLTPLRHGRSGHTCGVYNDLNGKQVLLVTGGWDGGEGGWNTNGHYFTRTEVSSYNAGVPLKWRLSAFLPSPRRGATAAVIGNNIVITGGRDQNHNIVLTTILSWDPVAESWQSAGDLAVTRNYHAAVAVPSTMIEPYCKAI